MWIVIFAVAVVAALAGFGFRGRRFRRRLRRRAVRRMFL